MPKPTPGQQYTITDEDTLSQVASRAYGNSDRWPTIWRANQSNLRSGDPNVIYPGEVIFIPELASLARDGIGVSNVEPDELTIVIDGIEMQFSSAKVMLTMDTASDGWTLAMPWVPGDNPELDARLTPFTYKPARVYIGGVLLITGYLYTTEPRITERGTVITLKGFSRTADIVDSTLRPPYEESNVTLAQRAEKLIEPHGIKAVFETDIGGPFDRVTAGETDTIFRHLNKLAHERGVLISSTADGNLLFTEANTKGVPVATLEEGQPPALDYGATFNGRLRFNTYRGIISTPFGNNESIVKDDKVPRSRIKTFRIQDSLVGEVDAAVKWARSKTLADALTIALPVSGWLVPGTSTVWKPNTLVTLISPSIFVPNGFSFLIRSVTFEEKENSKSAILNLVPPQVYTKQEVTEPWG